MIYAKGTKQDRKKTEVRLSVQRIFGYVVLSVFEGDKITHQFNADESFLRAMMTEASLDLRMLSENTDTETVA